MTTTLTQFAGQARPNYCTMPSIDVEILPDVRHCTCGAEVVFDPKAGHFGGWAHKDPATPAHGLVTAATRCYYCRSETDAVYRQHAWFDAVECSRCGGVQGYAIGD